MSWCVTSGVCVCARKCIGFSVLCDVYIHICIELACHLLLVVQCNDTDSPQRSECHGTSN